MRDAIALRAYVLVVASCLLGGRVNAENIQVNPSDFAPGTNISNAIPGVVLSRAEGSLDTAGPVITVPLHLISSLSEPVFAEGSRFAHSGGIIWSAGPCCNIHTVLRADFLATASRVSVLFLPDDNDGGVLQAYDAHDNLIDDRLVIANSPFTISISSPSIPIAYVLATYGDTGIIGSLSFEPAPVPIPSGVWFFACGMLVVGNAARKRRRLHLTLNTYEQLKLLA